MPYSHTAYTPYSAIHPPSAIRTIAKRKMKSRRASGARRAAPLEELGGRSTRARVRTELKGSMRATLDPYRASATEKSTVRPTASFNKRLRRAELNRKWAAEAEAASEEKRKRAERAVGRRAAAMERFVAEANGFVAVSEKQANYACVVAAVDDAAGGAARGGV